MFSRGVDVCMPPLLVHCVALCATVTQFCVRGGTVHAAFGAWNWLSIL